MKRRLWKFSLFALAALLLSCLSVWGLVACVEYPAARLSPQRGGPLLVEDHRGVLLRSLPSADGTRRARWVELSELPVSAINTLIASEDHRFFQHPGVDVYAIFRAAWLNLRSRKVVSGASTLTMQLMRMVHSPGQGRSLSNKLKEAILALRVERKLSKTEILEQYLNRAYYGKGAYGMEAAARIYFNKPAKALSVGEATLLSVIPRAPHYYAIHKKLGMKRALARRDHIFALLRKRKLMTASELRAARQEKLQLDLTPMPFRAPHFVDWVLSELPRKLRAQGGSLRTTLDATLQERMERRLREHIQKLQPQGVSQAGVVILETQSGKIRAMVGSARYKGQKGQLNITTWRRSPGSALKPFIYALSMARGKGPASIALDIRNKARIFHGHQDQNLERGPVPYRRALASSYNLSAIQVLQEVGVGRMLSMLRRAGMPYLRGTPQSYSPLLALGNARVRLLDLASAYGFLGRQGKIIAPQSIQHLRRPNGSTWRPPLTPERRLFSPQVSWMVMDVLSDPQARRSTFGRETPLNLPFKVAAKTGTAQGIADLVTVAVTREYTVAAWAGSFDGKAAQGLLAMQASAPLVRAGLLLAAKGRRLTLPTQPQGIARAAVCPLSGLKPGPACPHRRFDYFQSRFPLRHTCTWHRHREGKTHIHFPARLSAWAHRKRSQGGQALD